MGTLLYAFYSVPAENTVYNTYRVVTISRRKALRHVHGCT